MHGKLLPAAAAALCLAAGARGDDILGSASFDGPTADRLLYGGSDPYRPPPAVTFEKIPGDPIPTFRGVCRIRGTTAVRVPLALPSVEGVNLEDTVWFRFGAEQFGLLQGDSGGYTLLKFNKGGPQLRVRAHPTAPDAKIEYHDGTRWLDTGVDAKPGVPYRLRTVLTLDLKGQSADVFLWDLTTAQEKNIHRKGRFPPLVPEALERVFESKGHPLFTLDLAGWQIWDTARRLEPIGSDKGLLYPALSGRYEPRAAGDVSLIRANNRGYAWAALPVRRGMEDEFAVSLPSITVPAPAPGGKGPAPNWTGPGQVVEGGIGAAACLQVCGMPAQASALRRRTSLPQSDWSLKLKFRMAPGLPSGRMIHLVEFQSSQSGTMDRVGPCVLLRAGGAAGPGKPPQTAALIAMVRDDVSAPENAVFPFTPVPDAWYTLSLQVRPSSGKYSFLLTMGEKPVTDGGNRQFPFVTGADLTIDPTVDVVLGADPAYDLPAAARAPREAHRADAVLKGAPVPANGQIRGLAVAPGGRPLLLVGDGPEGRGLAVTLKTATSGGDVRGLKPPGPARGIAYDPFDKCWWLITPDRARVELQDPKLARRGYAPPPISRMDANFALVEWPPLPTGGRAGRPPREEFPIYTQQLLDIAAGPEELYVLTTGGLRVYEKSQCLYRRTLNLRGLAMPPDIADIAYGGGKLFLALRKGGRMGEGVLVVDPKADGVLGRMDLSALTGGRPVFLAADDADLYAVIADQPEGHLLKMPLPNDTDLGFATPYLLVERVEIKPAAVPAEADEKLIRQGAGPTPLVDWRSQAGQDVAYIGNDPGQYRKLRINLLPPKNTGLLLVEIATARRPDSDAPAKFFIGSLADRNVMSAGAAPQRASAEEFFRRAGAIKWPPAVENGVPRRTQGIILPAAAASGKPAPRELEIDLITDLKLTEGDVIRQIRLRRQTEDWAATRLWLTADDRGRRTEFAGTASSAVLELSAAAPGEDESKSPEVRLKRVDWDVAGPAGGVRVEYRQAATRYELAEAGDVWRPVLPGAPVANAPVGRFFQWRISLTNNDPYVPVRVGNLRFTFEPVAADAAAAVRGETPKESPAAARAAELGGNKLTKWIVFGLVGLVGVGVAWYALFRKPERPSAA